MRTIFLEIPNEILKVPAPRVSYGCTFFHSVDPRRAIKHFTRFVFHEYDRPQWFTSSSYLILYFDAGSKYSSSRLYRYSLFLFFETFLLGNFIGGYRTPLKGALAWYQNRTYCEFKVSKMILLRRISEAS